MSHPEVKHPRELRGDSRLDRVADWITNQIGNMRFFLLLGGFMLTWMSVVGPRIGDPYPFTLLLLIVGGVFQGLAMVAIMVSSNRADKKREAKADADHRSLTHIAKTADAILRRVK